MTSIIQIETMDGQPCGFVDISDPSKIQFQFDDNVGRMLVCDFVYVGGRLYGGYIKVQARDEKTDMRKTPREKLKSILAWAAERL